MTEQTPEEWLEELRREDRRFNGILLIVGTAMACLLVIVMVLVEVFSG